MEIAENSQTAFAKEIAAMKAVPSGKKYTQLCRECRKIADADERYHDLAGLSYAAWIVSKDANQQEKVEGAEETDTQNAAIGDTGVRPTHYWLYAPGEGACKWEEFYAKGVMGLGWSEIGDYRQYTSRAKMVEAMRDAYDNSASSFKNASLATWQFLHDVQIDDVIFVKQGLKKIIGRGIVGSDYYFQQNDHENDYSSFRKVNWTNRGDWEYSWNRGAVKTLTDVTQYTEQVKILEDLFTDNDSEPTLQQYSLYNETEFLKDVYMSYEDYHDLVTLLTNKKNVILQGAPSVGKTFAAKRLAYSVMGEKNPDRVMMVQFHQSYSYEDFIMGFRPNASGFELKYGVFYEFCKRAQDDDENNPYFFIIDEINRGNLSRIFGELFMLIENDKRGVELRLPYANETFSVPANVRIIGTMNTADRSLAMIDYALRRRFSFFEMAPGFDSDGFKNYQNRLENDKFDKLVSCIKNLNLAISQDESLGEGFRIGHSYFSNFKKDSLTDDALLRVVKYELVPLLKEYWFDEPQKVKEWQGKLESAVK